MSLTLMIYALGFIGKLNCIINAGLLFLAGLSSVMLIVNIIYLCEVEDNNFLKPYNSILIKFLISFVFLYCITPTYNTVLLMTASSLSQTFIKENNIDNKIISPSIDLLNEYINKQLLEMKENKNVNSKSK